MVSTSVTECMEPVLSRAGTGPRWLAMSAPGSGLRIGVIGRNETHARDEYRRRKASWLLSATEPVSPQSVADMTAVAHP